VNLKEINKDEWKCLVKPAKRVKVGTTINFGNILKGTCTNTFDEGILGKSNGPKSNTPSFIYL